MINNARVQALNEAVRSLFEMPAFPEPIRKDICLHCVIMDSGDDKGKEMLRTLTAVLREHGVNPKKFVENARDKGVTNINFKDGEVFIPTGFQKFLLLEASWHLVLSFDLLMEIAGASNIKP